MTGFLQAFTTEIGFLPMVARLALAAALGVVIGLDRELRNRPAGLRTHMLVALAAAAFSVLAFELSARAVDEGFDNVDPTRVLEAVTAGVAFLAAGSIIHARGQVHGVTTGAGLWLAGAIGTACGIGAFSVALVATVFGFFILAAIRTVEKWLPRRSEDRLDGGAAE